MSGETSPVYRQFTEADLAGAETLLELAPGFGGLRGARVYGALLAGALEGCDERYPTRYRRARSRRLPA